MDKTELDRLQQRLYMQARKVMDSRGHWVDPREAVVVYRRRTPPETEGGTP